MSFRSSPARSSTPQIQIVIKIAITKVMDLPFIATQKSSVHTRVVSPTETFNARECDGRAGTKSSMAGWCVDFDAGLGNHSGPGRHVLLQPRLADVAPGHLDAQVGLRRRRNPRSLLEKWNDLGRHLGNWCHGERGHWGKRDHQRRNTEPPPTLEYEGIFG